MSESITEQAVRDVVLEKARQLAKDNPGKSVDVTICACVFHTPSVSPDIAVWGVRVGHGESYPADTFTEALAKLNAKNSSEAKLAKIADLRRQATELEAELNPPPPCK